MSDDSSLLGGALGMLALVGLGAAFLYDRAVGHESVEFQTVVASATDARVSGGKFYHKYQVEILVTRDSSGELHKIDCPLKYWTEAKEGDTISVTHWSGPIFQKYKLNR